MITKSVGGIKTGRPHAGLVTVQGVAVTATRVSKSAVIAMISGVAPFIFAFYRFVAARLKLPMGVPGRLSESSVSQFTF